MEKLCPACNGPTMILCDEDCKCGTVFYPTHGDHYRNAYGKTVWSCSSCVASPVQYEE
jgi:hypothetical protein